MLTAVHGPPIAWILSRALATEVPTDLPQPWTNLNDREVIGDSAYAVEMMAAFMMAAFKTSVGALADGLCHLGARLDAFWSCQRICCPMCPGGKTPSWCLHVCSDKSPV